MKKNVLSAILGTAALLNFSAAAAEIKQVLPLDTFAVPQRWRPAESSVTPAGELNGRPAIKWEAPIDHFSGEKKYPVGWPRTYFNTFSNKPVVPGDWKDWDSFEFDVKITLEKDPKNRSCPISVVFACAGVKRNYTYAISKLHDGKVHSISVPIERFSNPAKVSFWGFSISESSYAHGGKLTVTAGNFRLVRSSECTVAEMKLLTPAITGADRAVKLNIRVTGPAGDVARGVPFELSCLKSGKVFRKETLPVRRGFKDIEIEIDELNLAPGKYKLTAFSGNKSKEKSVVFQILSSPFKVKK